MTCDIRYVSPSAIDTWELCPRRWGFRRLDRIPEPPAPWLELGTAVHGQHEHRYIFGVPYDLTTREGELADAAIHALPDPSTGEGSIWVEREEIIQVDGLAIGGKIDLLHETYPVPAVYDHKTGNPRYFKLEREELLSHPQAPVYGLVASVVCDAEEVDLRWNWVATKGAPRLYKSWHRVTADEAETRVRRHLPVVESIYDAASRFDTALQLPHNPSACYAYGRQCHYASRCNVNQVEIFMSKPNPFAQSAATAPAGAAKPNPFKTGVAAVVTPPSTPLRSATPPETPPAAETPVAPGPGDTSPDDPVNPPEKRKAGPGRPKKEKPVSAGGTVASDGQDRLGTSGTVESPTLTSNEIEARFEAWTDKVAERVVAKLAARLGGMP